MIRLFWWFSNTVTWIIGPINYSCMHHFSHIPSAPNDWISSQDCSFRDNLQSLWCCLLPGRFLAFCRNCRAPLVRQLPTRKKFHRELWQPKRKSRALDEKDPKEKEIKGHLVFGNIRGQNKAFVIGMYHNHDSNGTCCNSPRILHNVLFLFRFRILVNYVKHLGEILAQVMRGGSL